MKFPPFLSAIPPALRRPLLFCAMALAAALSAGYSAAAARAGQEARLLDARADAGKLEARLATARESAAARAALARRLAMLAATLGKTPPDEAGRERIAQRLSQDIRIAAPRLRLQDAPLPTLPAPPAGAPAIVIQRLSVDAGLLHEEALLALAATIMDSPVYTIPIGCALQRESGNGAGTSSESAESAAVHPLRARCEFDWISLAPGTGAPQ
ncbi:MAG: hypothetical protein LBF50_03895 [Azoarcus sp.]|jgi:hypothetical protein|nr:hypothetical protein [Azoarcus sp.]